MVLEGDEAKQRRDELFTREKSFEHVMSCILASQELIMSLERRAKKELDMADEIAEVIVQEKNRIKEYQGELKQMGF